jgi:hypothetical protein
MEAHINITSDQTEPFWRNANVVFKLAKYADIYLFPSQHTLLSCYQADVQKEICLRFSFCFVCVVRV